MAPPGEAGDNEDSRAVLERMLKNPPRQPSSKDIWAMLATVYEEHRKTADTLCTLSESTKVDIDKIPGINTRLKTVEDAQSGILDRLKSLENRCVALEKQNADLVADCTYFLIKAKESDERLDRFDRQHRRNRIVIHNVKEDQTRKAYDVALNLFRDLGIQNEANSIDVVYRPGSYNPQFKRPIVVILTRQGVKGRIFKAATKLPTIRDKWPVVYITDDLTPRQQDERAKLQRVATFVKVKSKDTPVRVTNSAIIIDKKPYAYKKLHTLPDAYSLDKMAMRETKDGGVGFATEDCLLSNFAKVGLVFRGLTPQQQPGSYQGGEMMMKSVFWWRKPEHPEETTDLRQVTDETFSHIRPLPSPGIELGPQRCEAK